MLSCALLRGGVKGEIAMRIERSRFRPKGVQNINTSYLPDLDEEAREISVFRTLLEG
jgi:hypothetical protein